MIDSQSLCDSGTAGCEAQKAGLTPVAPLSNDSERTDALLRRFRDLQSMVQEAAGDFREDDRRRKTVKVIIQIPCYNEEATLGITLDELPRKIDGVDVVEWLVVDDGSTDHTVEVALAHGVDHIVRLPRNQGLARAFMAGLDEALRQGADVIVNTDADNQYCARDIPKLVAPILAGDADLVVGSRPIAGIPHFSRIKKLLQWIGSWVVRRVSKTDIRDAPSGFRAISREAAKRTNVFSEYSYTLETLIQAGQNQMAICSVPIRTNADLRPSRLFRSVYSYVRQSALTILRIFVTYRSFESFAAPGAVSGLLGLLLCIRYLFFFFAGDGAGHVHSLLLGALLMGIGCMGIVVGLIADLISVNRKLLEKVDRRVRQIEEVFERRASNRT
jgi:glycosyltransferase involved in cell wall biosynthesis